MEEKKVWNLILKTTALRTLVAFVLVPVLQGLWQRKESVP